MNKIKTFQDFLVSQSVQIPVAGFVINIILTAFLAYLLSRLYVRYGTALSNRRLFARNFVILAMTTMFIIAVVKSSLALSLGLVGALSIVRFRAAIKEPEELSYLFVCIAIGLGLGADQRMITITAFFAIAAAIIFRHKTHHTDNGQNLHLTICTEDTNVTIDRIIHLLQPHTEGLSLKRMERNEGKLEASFMTDFKTHQELITCENELHKLSASMHVTFIDMNGIG